MEYYINKMTDEIRNDLVDSSRHFINDLINNQGKMVEISYTKRRSKNFTGNREDLREFKLRSDNGCDWNKNTTGYWIVYLNSSVFDKIFSLNKPSHFSEELFEI